jgi:hypothetical protein
MPPEPFPSRAQVAGLVVAAVLALLLYVAPDALLIGFAGFLLSLFRCFCVAARTGSRAGADCPPAKRCWRSSCSS